MNILRSINKFLKRFAVPESVWERCAMPEWCDEIKIQTKTKGYNIPVYFKGKHIKYKAIWRDKGQTHWSIYDYDFYRKIKRKT